MFSRIGSRLARVQVMQNGLKQAQVNKPIGGANFAPRWLSSATPQSQKMNGKKYAVIQEFMYAIVEYGTPGEECDKLLKAKVPYVERLIRAQQISLQAKMLACIPFGYEFGIQGLQQFFMEAQDMMQSGNCEEEDIELGNQMEREVWKEIAKRAFDWEPVPALEPDHFRFLVSSLSSKLQEPAFLKKAEQLYKTKLEGLAKAGKGEEAQVELYKLVGSKFVELCQSTSVPGISLDAPADEIIAKMQIIINIHLPGDAQASMAYQTGIFAVATKAPLDTSQPPPNSP